MSTPVQIVVAAFQNEEAAQAAYDDLKSKQKDGLIRIQNAAILRKDMDGKLMIKDALTREGPPGFA